MHAHAYALSLPPSLLVSLSHSLSHARTHTHTHAHTCLCCTRCGCWRRRAQSLGRRSWGRCTRSVSGSHTGVCVRVRARACVPPSRPPPVARATTRATKRHPFRARITTTICQALAAISLGRLRRRLHATHVTARHHACCARITRLLCPVPSVVRLSRQALVAISLVRLRRRLHATHVTA
jgi:hypothetical protein